MVMLKTDRTQPQLSPQKQIWSLSSLPLGSRFLVSGGVIMGLYFALSSGDSYGDQLAKVAAYCLVSGAAVAALASGLRLYRPENGRPWLWFLAGQMIYFFADCTFYVRHDLLGLTAYPSISEFLYLAHYPFIVIALVLFVRRRTPGRDRPALLDAAILGIGAATLVWVFLLDPQIQAGGPWLARAVSLAFPVLDLAILVVALRLVIGAGLRSRSFYLLTGGLGMVLAADIIYGLQQVAGTYTTGNFVNTLWLASYLLIGAAALDPSMADLTKPSAVADQTTSRLRLSMLALASLAAPTALVVQLLLGRRPDIIVCAAAASLMFLLVLTRMADLVTAQHQAAVIDNLTGLHNRRFFEAQLNLELERAKRSDQDVGLVTLDIDHFKSVNDTYGHPGGDRVLIQVAEQIRNTARAGDVVARYGGEEFAVLMPGISGHELTEAAERLRIAVNSRPMEVNSQVSLAITISAGAVSTPSDATTAQELVAVADRALYAAKRTGRNRTITGDGHIREMTPVLGGSEAPVFELLTGAADSLDANLSTSEHSSAISRWAVTLAQAIDLDEETRLRCSIAGRLHDIGKLFIPTSLLTKPTALTDFEWEEMRKHPSHGARLVGLIPGHESIADIIKQHHEHFDGTGYPHQLARQEIRIEARIVAICDSYAAMRADRPHMARLSADASRAQLLEGRGTQFDPDITNAFIDLLDSNRIDELATLKIPSLLAQPASISPLGQTRQAP
jgi:two-component system cell cycle response regulator